MRNDGTFIGIEVADEQVQDATLAAKLEEACPVDIYADAGGKVEIVDRNIDECVLCRLCIDAAEAHGTPGAVRVLKLYDNEAALA